MRKIVVALFLMGCSGGATARLSLDNQTVVSSGSPLLADGTSLRLKIVAVYLAEDVDPTTMNNVGATEMIWLNPQCADDISGCNVDGFAEPAGPRITEYFDLARPSSEVNADLNAQGATVTPGSYRYARVELCKSFDRSTPTVPTMMWAGPGMTSESPFTSGDCGRTSLAFDPPLTLAESDSVEVSLGYDLSQAIVVGPPAPPGAACSYAVAGHDSHCFRACVDLDATTRTCMDFPDFAPSASAIVGM